MSPEEFIGRVRKQARRILGGKVRGSDNAIFPGFWSFETSGRPRWWRDELSREAWGPVIGVHEVEASPRGAVVVTERGLAVYCDPVSPTWLPYEEIGGILPLSKEPVSKSLLLCTRSGEKIDLPFPGGGAFAFVQFIAYVTQQLALSRS